MYRFPQKYEAEALIIIRIVSWVLDHHFRMISEGSSCNPEDWSNNAENVALYRNNLHFNMY